MRCFQAEGERELEEDVTEDTDDAEEVLLVELLELREEELEDVTELAEELDDERELEEETEDDEECGNPGKVGKTNDGIFNRACCIISRAWARADEALPWLKDTSVPFVTRCWRTSLRRAALAHRRLELEEEALCNERAFAAGEDPRRRSGTRSARETLDRRFER